MQTPASQTYLAEIERHIAQGERSIARQRTILGKLAQAGHDTQGAEDLLRTFLTIQAAREARRRHVLDGGFGCGVLPTLPDLAARKLVARHDGAAADGAAPPLAGL